MIEAYGADRVLFGTDYSMWDIENEIDRFMKIELTDKEREDILLGNAARLYSGITGKNEKRKKYEKST